MSVCALGEVENHGSQVLEDGGRDHGLVAKVTLPQNEEGTQDDGEDEAGDDRSVVPRLGVSAPLERENEASDRGEDEASSEPIHVQEPMEPGLSRVLLGFTSERRGSLEEEGDGEEGHSSDGQVDVKALW